MASMDEWSEIEFQLFDDMSRGNEALYQDQWVQTMYDAALFEHDISKSDRAAVLDTLRDYMWDTYGLDFDAVFDWEQFRENYDRA